MRIETEIKLDFKDVLIRPKRSTLSTRSNVDISREFRFRHAQGRLPRRADRRRQHGHHRHVRDGARARPVPAVDRVAQALSGGRTGRVLQGPRAQIRRVLLDGHRAGRRGEVRPRDGGGGHRRGCGGALRLHRRRQRLHRRLRAPRRQDPRALPAPRHHGRQRRHRRDDRGADPLGRGHRQGRHRSRARSARRAR